MELEKLLSIAYDVTHRFGGGQVRMSTNGAINQSQYTQEFKMVVRPLNNRVPKTTKDGGTVLSSAVGYKELIVWVHFGDKEQWTGPEFSWLYMDRSFKWDGERAQGDLNNIDELRSISDMLDEEAKRIFEIEIDYSGKHGNLDGLVIEGYAVI
jgi:hypothetical protein